MEVMSIGDKCPNCGSGQFSVSFPKSGMPRPREWGVGVLGLGNCRDCNKDFLVRLAPERELAIISLLIHYKITNTREVADVLFP